MPQTIRVAPEEYVECIGFTMYAYLANKIRKRDLMKGSERYFGEFLEHFIRGKLAEVAFQRYFREIAKVDTLIDLDLPFWIKGEYLPDILAYKNDAIWNFARFWVEIKACVATQRWMLVSTTSVAGSERKQPRPYCVYVECRVDLPQDHVARLMKFEPKIAKKVAPEWKKKLIDIEAVDVTVLGYALYSDINKILKSDKESRKALDETFGPGNWRYLKKKESFKDIETDKSYGNFGRDNCIIRLTRLRRDWKHLFSLAKSNKALAPEKTRDLSTFSVQMEMATKHLLKQKPESWFQRSLTNTAPGPLNKWVK